MDNMDDTGVIKIDDKAAELCEMEYKAAGVYGKVLPMPEIKKAVMAGKSNRVIKAMIAYCDKCVRWPRSHKIVVGCNIRKPANEKFKFEHFVQCSDGKQREYMSELEYRRPIKKRIGYPEIEAFRVDDAEDDKCYSFNGDITPDTMEQALLDKQESAKLDSVRMAFAFEVILKFIKEHGKADSKMIEENTILDGSRCYLALGKLVRDNKLIESDGFYTLKEGTNGSSNQKHQSRGNKWTKGE